MTPINREHSITILTSYTVITNREHSLAILISLGYTLDKALDEYANAVLDYLREGLTVIETSGNKFPCWFAKRPTDPST